MTHPFELEFEMKLPADPEAVWEAIATGPGLDSWFMGRNEVEPRAGGAAAMETGGHREEAVVTAYDPGKRFASRTSTGPDGRFMAFEYLLEGRGGGSTVLRIVHSGMLGDGWEDEYDALRRGWPFHLNTLREYLMYFPGRIALPVFAMTQAPGVPAERVRALLAAALSLPTPVRVGDRADGGPAEAPVADGEVVWADDERFEIRGADAIFTFHHGSGMVAMFHHLFGDLSGNGEGNSSQAEAAWRRWLTTIIISDN